MTTAEAIVFIGIFVVCCGLTYACIKYKGFLWLNIVAAALWYVMSYYLFMARTAVTAIYANVFWAMGILTVIIGFAILFMPLYVRDKEAEREETSLDRYQSNIDKHEKRIRKVRSMGRKKPRVFID